MDKNVIQAVCSHLEARMKATKFRHKWAEDELVFDEDSLSDGDILDA